MGNSVGGRPKILDDVKEAIWVACLEAVEILIGIMRNPKEKTPYTQSQDISFDVNSTTDVLAQIRRAA